MVFIHFYVFLWFFFFILSYHTFFLRLQFFGTFFFFLHFSTHSTIYSIFHGILSSEKNPMFSVCHLPKILYIDQTISYFPHNFYHLFIPFRVQITFHVMLILFFIVHIPRYNVCFSSCRIYIFLLKRSTSFIKDGYRHSVTPWMHR